MTIKAFDTDIVFSDTLSLDGAAVDLTGASVKFLMKPTNGGAVFSDDGVPDADQTTNKGKVTYQPGTGFPTATGIYLQEWEVTKSEKVSTFPGDSYNTVRILEDLNNGVAA